MEIRQFLIPRWIEKQSEISARKGLLRDLQYNSVDDGMCRFTAYFMSKLLTNRTGTTWRVAGGEKWDGVYSEGGFLNTDGEWAGHERKTNGKTILDITAAQFGAENIIVTSASDSRYVANYSKEEMRDHLTAVKETSMEWLKQSRDLLKVCLQN